MIGGAGAIFEPVQKLAPILKKAAVDRELNGDSVSSLEVDRKLIGYSGNGSGTHRENSWAYSEGKNISRPTRDHPTHATIIPDLLPIYCRSTAALFTTHSRS